ncbi:MAG: ATP-dependent DNA helicase, partial [Propionibacteriaceae bacterium]|nr:ATP-dependent DNA helicase [Propionibacteriaceae bacterium]
MTQIVDEALETSTHALIQAGTGTGKSLGYLVPLVAHLAANPDQQAVVATATLALQSQLASKDIPTVMAAAADLGLPEVSWAVLKGGSNYPCLLKIRQAPVDPADMGQDSLPELGPEDLVDESSSLGEQVVMLRTWAENERERGGVGDRDDAPRHIPRAWSQVAIAGRECVGSACPYVGECFVQNARAVASTSQLVVTNHALVAIEAEHGWSGLNPDVLVVDEAHEMAARVTNAATDELSPQMVDRVARMAKPLVTDATADNLRGAADRFAETMEEAEAGRIVDGPVIDAVRDLRTAVRATVSGLGRDTSNPAHEQVANAVKEVFDVCERVCSAGDSEVVWVSSRPQFGAQVVVAPLKVDDSIRESILAHQPTILTSATLTLGESFRPLVLAVGLEPEGEDNAGAYTAVDVGSPFDYSTQGICYVAAHLPPPGRDGTSDDTLTEIAELVQAANGHTLGLFSSMRGAQFAADYVRDTTGLEVLLQGEGHLPDLIARFLEDPETSLFGTLSLWQGVDAPGDTCNLVIVDRIPFPRPDEPLIQARSQDVSRRGGNGFMEVSASHAALMLAQGAGRLIRTTSDKGVVAILDSRLATARYASFLITSMPPLWMTSDKATVLAALRRLNPSSG